MITMKPGCELFFKSRKLSVNKDTKMIIIMTILGEAGVLFEGNYHITDTYDATFIDFKATDTQWKLITTALENMNQFDL